VPTIRRVDHDARRAGWEEALRELAHLAEHYARPANGEEGQIIARGLRDVILILRAGGLVCEHRPLRA
jgi:hypothetical protein